MFPKIVGTFLEKEKQTKKNQGRETPEVLS